MTSYDRFPVPVRSAVKSNLTIYCCALGVISALGVLNDYALYKSTHSLTHSKTYLSVL